MNIKKNFALVVSGAICLVVSLVLIVLLFNLSGKHAEISQQLEMKKTELQKLSTRRPYPSDENVKIIKNNRIALESFLNGLVTRLSSGQREPRVMEPAEFAAFLQTTTRGLRKLAAEKSVKLPQSFAFGFDVYEAGALPELAEIARLQDQVFMVEELSQELFTGGVRELVSIERNMFDQVVEEPEVEVQVINRRGQRVANPEQQPKKPKDDYEHDLFFREKFKVTFYARESGLWALLEKLASSRLFVVVESVELLNESEEFAGLDNTKAIMTKIQEWKAPKETAAFGLVPETVKPAPPAEPPSRDERIVAGRERIKVTVEVSVLKFKAPAPETPPAGNGVESVEPGSSVDAQETEAGS